MSSRTPFSINLDEDYEIYGIDPNENLDDWSFLDAKPEPLPERDEEEKRLFEQLLAPTIPDDEIQTEIHDRLKSLLEETSKFIENDVKVELSAPIEISEDQINQYTDKDSFEHKQADRMSTIVKDILNTTQEAEDMDDLIKTLTRSDELAEKINEEEKKEEIKEEIQEEKPKSQKSKISKSFSKTSPATLLTGNESKKDTNDDPTPEPQSIPEPENPKENPKSFLDRYKRKPGAVSTIIRDHDQTERLSSKFLLEKKKREEENQAELEKRIKEREEKQKNFFESLDKEVEKHKREVQMIKEIKESKAPTLSEMINQIRPQNQGEAPKEINPSLLKPKQKKAEKPPPRYTKEKIDEFLSLRKKKLQPKPNKPVLVIELSTNKPNSNAESTSKSSKKKSEDKENTPHLSSTYQKKVSEKLASILAPLIKERKKTDVSKIWRIAIFLRMAHHLKYSRLSHKFIQFHLKLLFRKWRLKRKLLIRKRTLAAISIQRAFRRYTKKQKEKKQMEEKLKEEKLKEEKQKERKEITDQQILDKTRQMLNQKVSDSIDNPSQKYHQEKPKPTFSFPVLNDPDTSWIDTFEKQKIDGDDSSGLFFENDELDELPNKQILRFDEVPSSPQTKSSPRHKHHKSNRKFQAESQSIPFETDVYDYLSKFGQKIDIQDKDIEGQEIDIYDKANSGSKHSPKKDSKTENTGEKRADSRNFSVEVSNNEPSPEQQENKPQGEGYNFKSKDASNAMQKMLDKKAKQRSGNKNERPLEKFSHAPNIKHMPQSTYNINLRSSNTRAKRLKNLKKVWLGPHPDQQQQDDQPPPNNNNENNE